MPFFPVSHNTLTAVAKSGSFEDVAGFLVIARHCNGFAMEGYKPHTFSGAGVNAIHEKVKISEEGARGVMARLIERGFIRTAPDLLRKRSPHCRLQILQEDADLALPHSFVDPGPAKVSPLARLKKFDFLDAEPSLKTLTDSQARLDCLMVLLGLYRHSSMNKFGGLNPECAERRWRVETRKPEPSGVRWGAVPQGEFFSISFVEQCLAHCQALPTERSKGYPASKPPGLKSKSWDWSMRWFRFSKKPRKKSSAKRFTL